MRSTFKVLFYLKKNAPKKNGSVPVMCRITIDGTIAQFSCKMRHPSRFVGHQEQPGFGKECRSIRNQPFLGQDTCRHQCQIQGDSRAG